MTWYHLSTKSNLTAIVKTNAPINEQTLRPSVPSWIVNLKPEDNYKEPNSPKRVSVAPTVWQCVAGLGRASGNPTGIMYIYEVHTSIIYHRTFSSPETEITDEQWIADDVINERIAISQIGCIRIDQIFLDMKKCTTYKTIDKMRKLNEFESFWSIGGDINGVQEYVINNEEYKKIIA